MTKPFQMKKAHQQLAAVSVVGLLLLSLFSVLIIPSKGDEVTGYAGYNPLLCGSYPCADGSSKYSCDGVNHCSSSASNLLASSTLPVRKMFIDGTKAQTIQLSATTLNSDGTRSYNGVVYKEDSRGFWIVKSPASTISQSSPIVDTSILIANGGGTSLIKTSDGQQYLVFDDGSYVAVNREGSNYNFPGGDNTYSFSVSSDGSLSPIVIQGSSASPTLTDASTSGTTASSGISSSSGSDASNKVNVYDVVIDRPNMIGSTNYFNIKFVANDKGQIVSASVQDLRTSKNTGSSNFPSNYQFVDDEGNRDAASISTFTRFLGNEVYYTYSTPSLKNGFLTIDSFRTFADTFVNPSSVDYGRQMTTTVRAPVEEKSKDSLTPQESPTPAATNPTSQPVTYTGETSNGIGKRDYSVAVEMTNGVVTKLTVVENCLLACWLLDGTSSGKVKGTYNNLNEFVRDCGATCGEMKVIDGNGASKTINELINSQTAPSVIDRPSPITSPNTEIASDISTTPVDISVAMADIVSKEDFNGGSKYTLSDGTQIGVLNPTSTLTDSGTSTSVPIAIRLPGAEKTIGMVYNPQSNSYTLVDQDLTPEQMMALAPLATHVSLVSYAQSVNENDNVRVSTGMDDFAIARAAQQFLLGLGPHPSTLLAEAAGTAGTGSTLLGSLSTLGAGTIASGVVAAGAVGYGVGTFLNSFETVQRLGQGTMELLLGPIKVTGQETYNLKPREIFTSPDGSTKIVVTTGAPTYAMFQGGVRTEVSFGNVPPETFIQGLTQGGYTRGQRDQPAQTGTTDQSGQRAQTSASNTPSPQQGKKEPTWSEVFNGENNGVRQGDLAYYAIKETNSKGVTFNALYKVDKDNQVWYRNGDTWVKSKTYEGIGGHELLDFELGKQRAEEIMAMIRTSTSDEVKGSVEQENTNPRPAAVLARILDTPLLVDSKGEYTIELGDTERAVATPFMDGFKYKGTADNQWYYMEITALSKEGKLEYQFFKMDDQGTMITSSVGQQGSPERTTAQSGGPQRGNNQGAPGGKSGDETNKDTSLLSKFRSFQTEYAKYQGVAGFSSLFLSQEFLAEWRNNIESVFAQTYLGTQYWSSELCSQYVDGKNEGFVFANTPQGLSELAAFVKATRTPAAINENKTTSYIYFIEVRVKNGNSEKDLSLLETLRFNVELRGTKTAQLFSEKKSVGRGKEFKKLGKNAIAQDSNFRYDTICLVMDEVPYRWRISGKEICSPIPDNTGTPTSVVPVSSSGGTSAPALPEVNDI